MVDCRKQLIGIERFYQMDIESGIQCSLPIRFLTITGQSNQADAAGQRIGSQPARNFITIDAGQSDINDRKVWLFTGSQQWS